MALTTSQAASVVAAAQSWAKAQGLGEAHKVSLDRAPELVAAVSQATSLNLSAVEILDAVITAASVQNASGAQAMATLGAAAGYQGGAVHTPLSSSAGQKPLAVRMSPVETLQRMDLSFRLEDIPRTRIALTDDASPTAVQQVVREANKIIKLYAERDALLDDGKDTRQVDKELSQAYRGLTSAAASNKGVFLSVEGAQVEMPGADSLAQATSPSSSAAGKPLVTAAAIGVDPKTGERVVLQPMGRVQHDVSLGQLVKLFDEKATRNKNAQVLATDQAGIAALRSFDDKDLDARGLRDPKNLEYVTLSGDKSSEKGFTYPTRWVKDSGDLFSRRLVVDGPFRGVFLDDLASHLDEKSAADAAKDSRLHWLSPTKAGIAPLITTVTVDKGGEKKSMLRLRVPSSPEWTAVRQSLRALSDKLDGVSLVKDSKNTLFVFDAGNHGFIRKTAQFFGITAEAQSLVQQHVDELTKFEKALTPDAIAQYKAAKIGGFKTSITGRDGKSARFELSEIQQRSIARLVMDDYSGSLTLGMGMGKTLVALAAMQLLKKDGEKRPFLIVVPEGLEGGFHAEIHSKLEPTAAKALADQLVVMDHKTFRKAMRTGQHDGKKFDASKFGAAIYDEAHMLSDRKTASGKAMLSFAHPRTILMSGTPQPQPDKLQTMDAAAQGVNLNAPEARQLRKQARDWRKLLFNEVNGIAVSVKGPFELKRGLQIDPTRELLEWIRTRFIYADNFDDNVVLPKRTDMHVTLNMPKELEASYRSKSRPAATALQGLVSIYRDLGVAVRDDGAPVLKTDRYGNKKPIMTRQAKSDRVHDIKTELKPIIGELSAMTNTPDKTRLAGKKLLELMAEDEARGVPPSRALLFTDDKNYVKSAAQTLSQQQPSKLHVAALGDAIHVFRNGKELTELGPFKLPFSQQAYRADPNKPASASNPEVPAEAWRTFVLNEVVGKHKEVATSTLFGPVYQAGQNLQWANAVVHLDRDTWSDFNMRQREHRAHRRGQTRPVTVMHLDYVFNKPKTNLDRTLDEVRGLQAQNDRRLLAGTLQAAQKITLGEDFDAARLDDAFDHNERAGLKDLALLAAGVEPSGESIGLAGT